MKPRDYRAALAAHIERTPWAQRKAGRGIRIARNCVVRTVAGQALPITTYQMQRWV